MKILCVSFPIFHWWFFLAGCCLGPREEDWAWWHWASPLPAVVGLPCWSKKFKTLAWRRHVLSCWRSTHPFLLTNVNYWHFSSFLTHLSIFTQSVKITKYWQSQVCGGFFFPFENDCSERKARQKKIRVLFSTLRTKCVPLWKAAVGAINLGQGGHLVSGPCWHVLCSHQPIRYYWIFNFSHSPKNLRVIPTNNSLTAVSSQHCWCPSGVWSVPRALLK